MTERKPQAGSGARKRFPPGKRITIRYLVATSSVECLGMLTMRIALVSVLGVPSAECWPLFGRECVGEFARPIAPASLLAQHQIDDSAPTDMRPRTPAVVELRMSSLSHPASCSASARIGSAVKSRDSYIPRAMATAVDVCQSGEKVTGRSGLPKIS